MVTRTWKVKAEFTQEEYGEDFGSIRYDRASASEVLESSYNDFSNNEETRIIEVKNSDVTKDDVYSIISITMDTYFECEEELYAQISDGYFENCYVSEVLEI